MNTKTFQPILALSFLFAILQANAQLSLIKPIYPDAPTRDSYPTSFTAWGDKVVFAANDIDGPGLWLSDGTEKGTHKLFSGFYILGVYAADSLIYFHTDYFNDQRKIWVTDGKEANTRIIYSYDKSGGDAYLHRFGTLGNKLFFFYSYRDWNTTLIKSDGTEAGTFPVFELHPDIPPVTGDYNFYDDKLYFWTRSPWTTPGWYLWETDGTKAGSNFLFEYTYFDKPEYLQKYKDDYYFFARNDSVWGLWEFDTDSSKANFVVSLPSGISAKMLSHKDHLYLMTDPPSSQGRMALWRTNGERWNLELVKELPFGISRIFTYAGHLYLSGFNQLWRSDGTSSGTLPYLIFSDFNINYQLYDITFVDDQLYFISNKKLWVKTDKNSKPKSISPVYTRGYFNNFAHTNGKIIFAKDTYSKKLGIEPHSYDLVNGQIQVLSDVNFTPEDTYIGQFQAFDDKLFFVAEDHRGRELWQSDGSDAHTHIVADILPGPESSFPHGLLEFENRYYFTAADSQNHYLLWELDKEKSQPIPVSRNFQLMNYSPENQREKAVFNRKIYFAARKSGSKDDMRVFTFDLQDKIKVFPKDTPEPVSFLPADHGLFFVSGDSGSRALYFTDGTIAGTNHLSGYHDLSNQSFNKIMPMETDGSHIFFSPVSNQSGQELFISDGTSQGSKILKDIYSGYQGSSPSDFTYANGKLFFSAKNKLNGRELWVSDGTNEGTQMLCDCYPGSLSSLGLNPETRERIAFKKEFYFSARNRESGVELWKTDASGPGTYLFKDLAEGPKSSNPRSFAIIDTFLYFVATDSLDIAQLWRTNGTESVTELLELGAALPDPKSLDNLTAFRRQLFFTGIDPVYGKSLYRYKVSDYPEQTPEFTHASIYLWPNPVDDLVNISLNFTADGIFPFEITDLNGRRILSGKWEKQYAHQSFRLDLSPQSSGVYFLIVRGNNEIYSTRILKK